MDFSPYDGTTNVIEWLQKCEDYFEDQGVINDAAKVRQAKVRQATFVLTGQAHNWHNNLRRLVTHRLGWAEFKRICKSHFGRAVAVNLVGELCNLQHTGTVGEYCSMFEDCLRRQTRLTGDQQLSQFCARLTNNLRKEVEYLRSETIFEAIEYTRDNEYKIEGDKRMKIFGGHLAPPVKYVTPFSKPAPSGNRGNPVSKEGEIVLLRHAGQRSAPPKKVWKKLTSVEMEERRLKGLCFNCDELFTPGHNCKPVLFHIMPVMEGENQKA